MSLFIRKLTVFLLAGVMAASVISMPAAAEESILESQAASDLLMEEPASQEVITVDTLTLETEEESVTEEETAEEETVETTDPAAEEVPEEEPEALPEEEPEALPEETFEEESGESPEEVTEEEPEQAAEEETAETPAEDEANADVSETAAEEITEEETEEGTEEETDPREEETEDTEEETTEEEFAEIAEEFSDSQVMYEYLNMDSDSLLSEYIGMGEGAFVEDGMMVYSIEPLYASSYNGNKLSDLTKIIYDELKTTVSKVANGSITSTKMTKSLAASDLSSYKWTASDLGVSTLFGDEARTTINKTAANTAINQIYDPAAAVKSLIRDCPCEMFWFGNQYTLNKTYTPVVAYDSTIKDYVMTMKTVTISINLSVAQDYQGADSYTTKPAKINAINSTISTVNGIISAAAGKDDLSKLDYYRQKICSLVTYDHSITSANYPGGYGNPWQIIYVFDGDSTTNVVCEGYAKAFQYLCDQSGFSGKVQAVYSVSGTFQAGSGSVGGHLWNIVKLNDGKNYMVDLTNSDGYSGNNRLYMVQPMSGTVDDGYQFVIGGTTYTYKYSSDTRLIYSDSELTLSPVHEWDKGTITSQPTCSKMGIKTYKCKLCSETKTEEFGPLKAHTVVTDPAVAANCTTPGKTKGTHCSVCGTVITAQKTIPAKGHTKNVLVPAVAATYFSAGQTESSTCTVCGATLSVYRTVPMLELTRVLKRGVSGEDVRQVQEKLIQLGYLDDVADGAFGGNTEAAVIAFQEASGLSEPDGMVGNWTMGKLREASAGSNSGDPGSSDKLTISETLKVGSTGSEVKAVQQRLYELGYLDAVPDGIYGNKTKAAVEEFQINNGLGYSDGMVGNWTIGKLNGNPVPKNGSNPGGSDSPEPSGTLTISETLKVGSTGNEVKAVQQRLYELGYLDAVPDGIYGNKTKAAVDDFQVTNGLGYCDGMVGNWTIGKLNGNPIPKGSNSGSSDKLTISETLKVGSTGSEVKAVQQRLYELGYLKVTPDGIYGNYTKEAVNAFQLKNGLGYSDGMVGNWTIGKLNGSPVAND